MTYSRFFWLWFHPHRVEWGKAFRAIKRAEHKFIAKMTLVGHLGYYSLVSVEAHGNYRYVAGGLALLVAWESVGNGDKME